MKKLSIDLLAWLVRHERTKDARLRRDANIRKRRKSKPKGSGIHRRTAIIAVPPILLAEKESHRKALHDALQSIMRHLAQPRTRVKLDFSKVDKMYPGGTLILIAYLEMIISEYPGRVVARCPPNSLPAQLMRHFNIADKIGIKAETSHPRHESVVNWRYLTGTRAESEKISELLHDYRQSKSANIPPGLYEVLTEALVNVKHHAYPEGCGIHEDLHRWWLFSRYVEPDRNSHGNLYIGIYDIGIGIQASLRQKPDMHEILADATNRVAGLVGRTRDQDLERFLLERAVVQRRTSTGLPNRGNGLPEMKDFIEGTAAGRFYIISGKAQYACIPAQSTAQAVSCQDLFLGTLILWSLPLTHQEKQP